MKKPKVSVLMPIYNTNESHLHEAIESILNQSYTNFEFLILNDSPDNAKLDEIVVSHKDERIKYFKNEKNLGITPSRNRLLELSKGEYLAVFDHDDISLPTRLEQQVAFLENNPDYGVVSSAFTIIGATKSRKRIEKNEDIKLALTKNCTLHHPASMIRKSLLIDNNISYEEEFSPAEDHKLWLSLIPYTKFYNLQEVLFEYREYSLNTSKVQKEKMLNASIKNQIFAKYNYPELYEEYLQHTKENTQMFLFGIPLFTKELSRYKNKGTKSIFKLFGVIPIFKSINRIIFKK